MESRSYYLVTPLAYTGAAHAFTYHATTTFTLGQLVQVPLGRRQVIAVVTAAATKPTFTTKPITSAIDVAPLPTDLLQMADWLSRYYAASPASVWSTMLPSGLAKTRRAVSLPPPQTGHGLPTEPLTAEQAAALEQLQRPVAASYLVQGVTGSGKTRLYLELTARALTAGQSAIILVPEITLTPQIVGQFEAAFGDQVLASHSKLTEAERHRIWLAAMTALQNDQPRVIVGPRSCLFMPVSKLGLIVVDECHETSYKQEQHPRYAATTAAAWRARHTGARLVLGSATPGLTEYYLAQVRRIEHIFLRNRANQLAQSRGIILDLRNKDLRKTSKFITQPLLDAIQATMIAGRQTLLYLNRRGSASSQICGDCGHVTTCPNCQLALTFHADLMRLVCHYCNFRLANPAVCPACGGANLRLLGGGTKRIEAEVERLFPQARLARLDRDSATLSHMKAVFKQLRAGQLDILIGTQMIAKGLDLPAIDTVGVVSADTMLHLPDYTAAERTFQLLSQVSGRAGRGDRPGQVFIQTYTPDHPAIVTAANHNYDQFTAAELDQRRLLNYPPFVFLLKLTLSGPSRTTVQTEASAWASQLRQQPGLIVVGPAPAFLEVQSKQYHWIITVKSKQRPPLVAIASQLPHSRWSADLDPVNLL